MREEETVMLTGTLACPQSPETNKIKERCKKKAIKLTLDGSLFNSFRPPAIRELMVLIIASPALVAAFLSSIMGSNIDYRVGETIINIIITAKLWKGDLHPVL